MSSQVLFSREITGETNGRPWSFWSEPAELVELQSPELYANITSALAEGKKGYSDGPFWYKIKESDQYGRQVIRTRNSFKAKVQDGRIVPNQQQLSAAKDTQEILDKLSEMDNGIQLLLAGQEQIKKKIGVSNFEPASGSDPVVD